MDTTVFLSYAREDLAAATRVYHDLADAGVSVWMDKVSLLPGERWERSIRNAIRSSRYFLALMSAASTAKRGFIQKELRYALEVLEEYPDEEIYLLPVRLDECLPTHDRLRDLNWTDLFPSWGDGMARILRVLGAVSSQRAPLPQFISGLYQSALIEFNGSEYYSYLRFFGDGFVIAVSTAGTPEDIRSWFVRDKAERTGHYQIRENTIRFSDTDKTGVVDYEGELVSPTELVLRVHSHINGFRDVKVFRRCDD